METVSRYLEYQNKVFSDEEGKPLEGDFLNKNTIFRYKRGKLDGGPLPAIETNDFHMEYFSNGIISRPNKLPAIISDYGDIQEYWENGERIK